MMDSIPLLANKVNKDVMTVKTNLKDIILPDKYNYVMGKLTEVGVRMNKLTIRNYQFMRSYMLYCYEKKMQFPIIDKDFVKMSFQVLIKKKTAGPSIKGNKLELKNKLTKFYELYKDKFNFGEQISGKNLSQIIKYESTRMVTTIMNNIKQHFCDFLYREINNMFKERKKYLNEKKDKYNANQIDELIKELVKDQKILNDDLVKCENNSDEKYEKIKVIFREKYLPPNIDISVIYDVNKNPQRYLHYMISLSRKLEYFGKKQLQFFPLRTEKVIPNFPLDTASIIDILMETDKNTYLKGVTLYQNEIWNKYFNLDNSIFKSNKYQFKYMIYTNCYSVSILFDNKLNLPRIIENKQKKIKASIKQREELKKLTVEERDILKKDKQNEYNPKLKNLKDNEEYKKLSKEEKTKITKEKRKLNLDKKNKDKEEYEKMSIDDKHKKDLEKEIADRLKQDRFPYIDELTDLQIMELSLRKKAYIDPGKIRLLTMLGDNGKKLTYSNRQRIKETKRIEYQRKLEKHKSLIIDGESINDIESELSDYNSKSTYLNTFLNYVTIKNKTNNKLFEKYENLIFRKLKWYGYINRQRSEERLVNNIKKTYGDDVVLMMGDWSISKQFKNFISTPMIGLKRMLGDHFDVINVDEYNTSKINYKTHEENKNLYLHITKYTKEERKEQKKKQKKNKSERLNKKHNSKSKKKKKRKKYKHNKVKDKVINEPILNTTPNTELTIEGLPEIVKVKGYYKLHSVLTYNMENNRLGCINRDRNAVFNIKSIVDQWLLDKTRPDAFLRGKIKLKKPRITKPKKL
jgi:hypothetical protein